jgi:type II secretory pathway pseudopilin PulG
MIVVAILSLLAVIANPSYKRYLDAGRTSEVMEMFGEFRNKEEAYRAENSTYLTTSSTSSETDFYPALLGSGEPKAKAWTPGQPTTWTTLGINPGKAQLYCGYVAIAGAAGGAVGGARGQAILNAASAAPTTAWWYLNASCDNDGNPAVNSLFTTAFSTTSVVMTNEHR